MPDFTSKTVLTIIGGMLTLGWQYYTGAVEMPALINGEIALLAGIFMRTGITSEVAKLK